MMSTDFPLKKVSKSVTMSFPHEDLPSTTGSSPKQLSILCDEPEHTTQDGEQSPEFNIKIKRTGSTNDIVKCEGRYFDGSQAFRSSGIIDVLTSYDSGSSSEHIQCQFIRDRSNAIYPTYELRTGVNNDVVLIIAKRVGLSAMGSFCFFDMSKVTKGRLLTKKSENYIGRLKSHKNSGIEYILVNNSAQEDELAAFKYIQGPSMDFPAPSPKVFNEKLSGDTPKNLFVIIPHLDYLGQTVQNLVGPGPLSSILRSASAPELSDIHVFGSKNPVLRNGLHSLNFRGRVKVPSTKNFQLIPDDEMDNIILQFGKIGDDTFNLDFKAPFNALQAFALALTQFIN